MKYWRLTLIEQVENTWKSKWRPSWNVTYLCKCECWVIKNIQLRNMKCWRTKSCGCKNREYLKNHKKHWKAWTREYAIWQDIKNRCSNSKAQKYYIYWARWITYPEKWESFKWFREDMQEWYEEHLTIDRKDWNNSYSKANCRWATPKEQANNTSWNRYLTYNWKTLTYSQWEDETWIKQNTISARINKLGWNTERTLTTK